MKVEQFAALAFRAAAMFVGANAVLVDASLAGTTYTYDALGRIVSVRQDDGKQTTYSYDASGNRTQTSVAVTTANRAPVAVPDTAILYENALSVSLDPRANDSDPDGNLLTVFSVANGTFGNASWNESALTYTSNRKRNGTDSIVYTVTDGQGMTSSGEVTVTLANLNPVAVNDTISLPVNAIKALAPTSNDSDPGGDKLQITTVSAASHGTTFLLAADGLVNYTPFANYTGPDSFTYTISDGDGGVAVASVDVTVTSTPPAPPVAVADTVVLQGTTGSGDPATVIFDPRQNDVDSLNGLVRIASVTQPPFGTAEIINAGTQIRITSLVAGMVVGPFSYTIVDSIGRTATADINATVQWN